MLVDEFLNFAISVSATLDDIHKKDEIHCCLVAVFGILFQQPHDNS